MDGGALICPESMKEDLLQLYETILKTHPNPFLYCTRGELDSAFRKAQYSVTSPKSILQFSMVVSSFVKTIRDSHTSFNPRDLLFLSRNKHRVTPFYLNQYGARFYLSKIYNSNIPIGVEIISIGEMTVDSLYKLTSIFGPNEAYTKSARKEIIPKMMGNVFNAQNYNREDGVNFKYINKTGDTISKEVSSIKPKQFYKKGNWYPAKELEYEFLNNVAYLRVFSFESRNEKRYKKKIDQFFGLVKSKSCNSVVIDVRENRGGYVLLLEHLLSYINANEETYNLNYTYKRSDLDRFETLSRLKKIDFIKKAKRVYPRGMISKEYDFFKSPKGTVNTILYEKKLNNFSKHIYKGECTLFVNGLSMSASVLMATWFKETNRGKIIGTPCFGSLHGTNGNPSTIFLNRSGLPISISTLKLTPNNDLNTKMGDLEIDKEISVSLKALKAGKDPFKNSITLD